MTFSGTMTCLQLHKSGYEAPDFPFLFFSLPLSNWITNWGAVLHNLGFILSNL